MKKLELKDRCFYQGFRIRINKEFLQIFIKNLVNTFNLPEWSFSVEIEVFIDHLGYLSHVLGVLAPELSPHSHCSSRAHRNVVS